MLVRAMMMMMVGDKACYRIEIFDLCVFLFVFMYIVSAASLARNSAGDPSF